MSDPLRRHKYAVNRILIPAARILSPEFNALYVLLSGSHVEILRNLLDYANRRETFVGEYATGHYFDPGDNDWDSIQAIVAELEEILMGNGNVQFGFSDTWYEWKSEDSLGGGTQVVNLDPVPAGYVYILCNVASMTNDSTTRHSHEIYTDGLVIPIGSYKDVPPSVTMYQHTKCPWIMLKEGDYVQVTFRDMVEDESGEVKVSGFKMTVPT